MELEFQEIEFHGKKFFISVIALYSGSPIVAFSCKFFYKCDWPIFRVPYSGVFKPYSGVFKPYSDVLNPYSGVFLQFMETESLKLDFHVDFFLHQTLPLTNRDLKT